MVLESTCWTGSFSHSPRSEGTLGWWRRGGRAVTGAGSHRRRVNILTLQNRGLLPAVVMRVLGDESCWPNQNRGKREGTDPEENRIQHVLWSLTIFKAAFRESGTHFWQEVYHASYFYRGPHLGTWGKLFGIYCEELHRSHSGGSVCRNWNAILYLNLPWSTSAPRLLLIDVCQQASLCLFFLYTLVATSF